MLKYTSIGGDEGGATSADRRDIFRKKKIIAVFEWQPSLSTSAYTVRGEKFTEIIRYPFLRCVIRTFFNGRHYGIRSPFSDNRENFHRIYATG